MPARLPLLINQTPLTAELRAEGVVLSGADDVYTAVADFDGRFRVSGPDGITTAIAAVAGNIIWISVDDEVFECRVGAAARLGSRGSDAATLAAPMPATIVKIAVHVGQVVAEGQLLIALEAMKMELPIRSPRAGTVAAIHCREAELVQPGIVLIDITAL